LWQRTSERGNDYLSGFLGKARIIAFRGATTADGTLTWNVYLQPGREQSEAEGSSRGGSNRRPTGVRRWMPKVEKPTAHNAKPFFDDPIDDVGPGGNP
jgi:hypothetical protein